MCVAGLVVTGAAQAQTATGSGDYDTGYVEGIAQSAFGNVTSQSFGAEAGIHYGPHLRFFGELGLIRDTAADSLGTAAEIIAGYLTQTQSGAVSHSVRQPVFFIGGGVRYVIPYDEEFEPYVVGGFGLSRVKRDVAFSVSDTDVTDTIGSYGVALGSDLSGTSSRPMLNLGGGLVWNARRSLFVDLQYRFGRVYDDGQAFTVNRVGAGIGVRF
jgi:opacity protein-like surface antigen